MDVLFVSNSYHGYYLIPWLREHFPELPIVDYVHMEEWYWRQGGYARASGMLGAVTEKTYVCNSATRDVLIENVTTYGPNEVGIRFYENFECENLTIRNLTFRSQAGTMDSVFWMNPNPNRVMKNMKIENVYVGTPAKYVFRGTQFPVDNFVCPEPTEGWFTPNNGKLGRAYGRYHYCSNGRVIEGRPKDNRIDGTLKTPAQLAAE